MFVLTKPTKHHLMQKEIAKVTPLLLKPNPMGFTSVDMFQHEFNFEPFLVFTEFHMDRPIFGPHPHAGVSVMTYMMPDSKGSFLNRDSRGDQSIIEPGGIHVTQTGSGIKHDEVPTVEGVDCHGFQIWINHSDQNRLVEPKAYHASADEVPECITDLMKLRVVQGSYAEKTSPIQLVTDTTIFDVSLQAGASVELPAKAMAFIYLMAGGILINGKVIQGRSMVSFNEEGDQITIQTAKESAHFIFASGTPHHEPIVYGGPFVMTTEAQMRDTKLRMGRGEMGELHPL